MKCVHTIRAQGPKAKAVFIRMKKKEGEGTSMLCFIFSIFIGFINGLLTNTVCLGISLRKIPKSILKRARMSY